MFSALAPVEGFLTRPIEDSSFLCWVEIKKSRCLFLQSSFLTAPPLLPLPLLSQVSLEQAQTLNTDERERRVELERAKIFRALGLDSCRAFQNLASSPSGLGNFNISLVFRTTNSKINSNLSKWAKSGQIGLSKYSAGFGANWARACQALGLCIAGSALSPFKL